MSGTHDHRYPSDDMLDSLMRESLESANKYNFQRGIPLHETYAQMLQHQDEYYKKTKDADWSTRNRLESFDECHALAKAVTPVGMAEMPDFDAASAEIKFISLRNDLQKEYRRAMGARYNVLAGKPGKMPPTWEKCLEIKAEGLGLDGDVLKTFLQTGLRPLPKNVRLSVSLPVSQPAKSKTLPGPSF